MIPQNFPLLIRLLKNEYHCYTQFKREFPQSKLRRFYEREKISKMKYLPSDILRSSFSWSASLEGWKFWNDIYESMVRFEMAKKNNINIHDYEQYYIKLKF